MLVHKPALSVTICLATPLQRWRRKEKKLPTGEEEIVGTTMTFSQVTRQHAGYYLCMADNGFGPSPVQKEVRLQVHCEEYLSNNHTGFIHILLQMLLR